LLKQFCKDMRLTQKELAIQLNCTQALVNMILKGKHIPTPRYAIMLEKITSGLIKFKDWYDETDRNAICENNKEQSKETQICSESAANDLRLLSQQGRATPLRTIKDMATGRIYYIVAASTEI
jgi:hypothetical protein